MRFGFVMTSFAVALASAPAHALAANDRVRTYEVRGEVARPPEVAARKLWIRHEAVPDFVDASGTARTMQPMVMQFDVAPGVVLDGVRPGDKVEFQLAVGWSPPLMRIDRLQMLPPDTPLRFTPAAASTPTSGSGAPAKPAKMK